MSDTEMISTQAPEMNELGNAIIGQFNGMVKSGAIDKIIEKQVEALVSATVKESLSSYSSFAKAIKEKLEKTLVTKLDEIDVIQYSDMVTKMVVRRLNSGMIDLADASVEKNIGEFMDKLMDTPVAKLKLSVLMEQFVTHVMGDDEEKYSGEVGFKLVEDDDNRSSSYRWYTLYLKEDGPIEKETYGSNSYTHDYKMRLIEINDTGKVTVNSISLKYDRNGETDKLFKKQQYGFEKLLFDLYCRGTEIELDEDDCTTEWSRD